MDEELLKGKTILVVDDETDLRDIVASEFEFMGAKVEQAENVSSAKIQLQKNNYDLIVSDIRMPGGTGIDLLDHVRSKHESKPPVILITGFADITTEDAYNKGAEALMNKPFKLDDLIQTASKVTLNLDERYNGPKINASKKMSIDYHKSFDDVVKQKEFKLGRGGLGLKWDTKGKRIELNENLEFEFKFTDCQLKGIGICRWHKHLDEPGMIMLGLEFVSLEPDTYQFVSNHWNQHKGIPFIPTL